LPRIFDNIDQQLLPALRETLELSQRADFRAMKLVVKLFLRHPLHAKLYLLHLPHPINPIVSYLGSSNLTFAGLAKQGELNVDVLDHDACNKLARWFEDRWNDRWCIDISEEVAQIIEQSWAREELIPPYHIYIKIAYHLSQEARAGLSEFRIPRDFGDKLFDYQTAAVKISTSATACLSGTLLGWAKLSWQPHWRASLKMITALRH
jgi:hypothetical protein